MGERHEEEPGTPSADGLAGQSAAALAAALRQARRALLESEARGRMLSEASPLGVHSSDPRGRRTHADARALAIDGWPPGQGPDGAWSAAVHEDDRERVVAAWRELVDHGRALAIEFRIRRPDGRARGVRTRARPVHDGGVLLGFVGTVEELSDRRDDEERLRASEQFLDRTGRIAGVGGWEVDLRTRVVHWSAHTRRIHEVDADFVPDLAGALRFYPPQARERLETAIEGAIRAGSSWDLELPFVTAKGRALWVRAFGEVESDSGRPVRLLGAFQDVTEYRRNRIELLREQELRIESERHAGELARLSRERGEMLDVLAHEVRQPLNNASAALQSAAAAVDDLHEPSASSRLAKAQTVLGQVLASIDNTLAVASLLARPEPLGLQDADIDTLLAVAIADMLPADAARVGIDRGAGTRTATMDMSLMRLALRNLLSNALRYGAPGTPVTVRVRDWDEPLALVIEVSNRGTPIPAAWLPRLFERGAKRGGADAAPPGGLGLGLYIVRRVMELHGGSVALAENTPSAVTFRLVLTQQAEG